MADNLTTQSGTPATVPSSSVIATDDVAGVHFQRVKLVDGTLDSNVGIAGDATNGLDVDVTRVQGTVTVGDGGGTLSVDDGGGSLTVDGTVAVSGSVAVTGPLTDAQLRATAVPVSGTFYQATQPVSGTVGVSGTVTVDGSGVTQPVSATSLPLPSGAATAANQSTANTNLSSIDTKTPSLGQALAASSVPVVLPAAQITTLTPPTSVGITGTPAVTLSGTANQVTQVPATSGGLSTYRRVWGASTFPTAPVCKTSAGQIYGWVITNTNAAPRFVKFYEKASDPTLASDTPKLTIMVPGNTSGAGVVAAEFTNGIPFANGIAMAVTTEVSDTGATAPSASEVVVNILYK